MIIATLKENVKSQLNEHQINFVERGLNRVLEIQETLKTVKNSEIKFFYIKELFILFAEMEKVKFTRSYEGEQEEEIKTTVQNLKQTIAFYRNVVSHFPFYNTWSEIWISKEYTKALQSKHQLEQNNFGSIYKYLAACENMTSYTYRVKLHQKDEPYIFTLRYPKNIEEDTKIYFKDMVNEDELLMWLFDLTPYLY